MRFEPRLRKEEAMATVNSSSLGSVVAIWRYPVKSMMGEELNASDITERGLLGDRAYALVDSETGRVVSAKNPRKWPNMFDHRAAYVEPPEDAHAIPPVRITFPDGSQQTSGQAGAEERLSESVGRPVKLATSSASEASIEGYWPDHEFLPERDVVFEVELPTGTFFDIGLVHIVTTATLDRLRALAPDSRFEVRRFRPNLVIGLPAGTEPLLEKDWVGKTISLGGEVRLHVNAPTGRCVMTTLSQGDLPKDPGILRAIVGHNQGNVGVYASVVRAGRVRRGDAIAID
jgi:uncharacterized protein